MPNNFTPMVYLYSVYGPGTSIFHISSLEHPYSIPLLLMCPNHLSLTNLILSSIDATPSLSLIISLLIFNIKRINDSHEFVLLDLDIPKNSATPCLKLLFDKFKFTSNDVDSKTRHLHLPPPQLFNEVGKTLKF